MQPTVHWRDMYTGFNRTALGTNRRFRGKGGIKLKLLAFQNRLARVTVAVGSEALKLAAERKPAGAGLESRVKEAECYKGGGCLGKRDQARCETGHGPIQ
jgi:hypothetical protein